MSRTQEVVDRSNFLSFHKECVVRCEDYEGFTTVVNRCLSIKTTPRSKSGSEVLELRNNSVASSVAKDLANSWITIVISCVIALVISFILLLLIRYQLKYLVWFVYIGLIVILLIGSLITLQGSPLISGAFAVVAIITGLLLYWLRKRIRLGIQLFKEAFNALFAIPLWIILPIRTFIAQTLLIVPFAYFAIFIENAAHLTVENDENGKFVRVEYQRNGATITAHFVNFFIFLWFTSFVFQCQNFVIASVVSDWFCARTESKIDAQISKGFLNLRRFHLGPVHLGSMLSALVSTALSMIYVVCVSYHQICNEFLRRIIFTLFRLCRTI